MKHYFIASVLFIVCYFIYAISPEFPPFLKAVICYPLTFFFPGLIFFFLERDVEACSDPVRFIVLPFAVSPYLFSLFTGIGIFFGMEISTAISISIITFSILLWCCLWFCRPSYTFQFNTSFYTILIFTCLCTSIISIPQISNLYIKLRGDCFLHAPVVLEILKGHVPPGNPFFAEEMLGYYWFYHLYAAIVCQITSLPPHNAMALTNIHALFVFILLVYMLSASFKKAFSHRFLPAFLVMFGLNAFGWIFFIINILKKETTWDRALYGGVGKILKALVYDFDVRIGALISKFMVPNPFPWGLVPIVIFLYYFFRYFETRKTIFGVFTAISLAMTIYFHIVSGCYVLGVTVISLFILFIHHIFRKKFSPMDNSLNLKDILVKTLIFTGILCVLILPYLYTIFFARSGTSSAYSLSITLKNYKTLLLALPLPLFFAFFQISPLIKNNTTKERLLIIWTGTCLFTLPLFRLNAGNEYKLFYVILIPLSLLSGWTIADLLMRYGSSLLKKTAFLVILFLVFLPTNLLAMFAYQNNPREFGMSDQYKKAYEWVNTHTDESGVFIESVHSNYSYFTTMTNRRLFVGNYPWLGQWGIQGSKIKRRKSLIDALFKRKNHTETIKEIQSIIHDPLYIFVKRQDLRKYPHVVSRFEQDRKNFRRIYKNDALWIFKIK